MTYFSSRTLRMLCLLLLGAAGRAAAQAPGWQMALAIGTPVGSVADVAATAADASGNVYLAGVFYGTATFGITTLTSPSSNDLFVAKWNPTTGFVWVQQAGGTGDDAVTALAVNGSSVYVAGTFRSPTIPFGATMLTNATGTGTSSDGFVAKLTDGGSAGTWVWAQQAGETSDDYVTALAVSGGSVYVAGVFTSPTLTLGATTLTSVGGNTGFVAKLTDAGSSSAWTWAQQGSGMSNRPAWTLAVSGGSVYVAGDFISPSITFGATTLTNTGDTDVFVAKLTDGGSTSAWTWAQQASGAGVDHTGALAVDGTSVYVAGGSSSPTLTVGATTLTSAGGADTFVAKLTDGGSTSAWTWAQQAGGASADGATALAVSGGNVYVAGLFYSPTLTVGATTLTNAGSFDGFVAKLTDAGSTSAWTWALPVGGAYTDAPKALTVSGSSVYVAGYFYSPTLTFGSTILTATGVTGFLAALTDPLLAIPAEGAPTPFTLAPNPTHLTATLTGLSANIPTATLLDALGRVVRTVPMTAGTATLDVRGLPAGLYFVQAGGAGRRLVVE